MRVSPFSFGSWILVLLAAAAWPQPMRADDAANDASAFGKETQSEAALMGVFYDLKQTPQHKPTETNPANYFQIVDEFLSKNWDETVLNRYYRVSKPLYTTQIFVPQMNANTAPKAFGAENLVQPSQWIIHYKGQVSPPEPGTYRFVGCADDLIAVAVNGKTELSAKMGANQPNPVFSWQPKDGDGPFAFGNRLRYGDWFTLKENEIIDLDVIIGERPGGSFNAYLLIQKQGATYEMTGSDPVLPIFQVARYDTISTEGEPRFAKGFPTWKSYQ